jgi:hypothetical protein
MKTDVLACALIRLAAILLFFSGIEDTTTTLRDCLSADMMDTLVAFTIEKSSGEAERARAVQTPDTSIEQDNEARRRRVILPPPEQDEDLALVKNDRAAKPAVFRPRTIWLGFAAIGVGIGATGAEVTGWLKSTSWLEPKRVMRATDCSWLMVKEPPLLHPFR